MEVRAYGLWPLVVLNVAIFATFVLSFARPRTRRDWRSFGAFVAFLVALFTEMYGFPLTIYLLAGWLQTRYPGLDLLSHNAGHLWQTLLGWRGDPHLNLLHVLSNALIGGGILVLGAAWDVLHKAQQGGRLATTGPYAYVRHPQYVAFVQILTGFLLQWPTLLTLLMFPVLLVMYVRLARHEERELLAAFGDEYAAYMATTPAFLPPVRPASDQRVRGALAGRQEQSSRGAARKRASRSAVEPAATIGRWEAGSFQPSRTWKALAALVGVHRRVCTRCPGPQGLVTSRPARARLPRA